ncbi:MAG: adventurous gliding motility lipoprotein CglB [Myxococcaceae bacterium]|nr:adventurous gliding motility lipoprotein CglB [Myxococcaceae bacterium]
MIRALATLAIAVTFLPACGRTNLPCLPETCSGCCDAFDTCRPGAASDECGASGSACVTCASGATCQQGRCVGGSAGGGTAGGAPSGGGAATGGGSAGGTAGGGVLSVSARRVAPDVMLVVDRSGSMAQPLMPMDPACRMCMGGTCPPGCVTRGRQLQQSVSGFAAGVADVARLGLVLFPSNASCGGPSATAVPLPLGDDPSELQMHADAVTGQVRMATFGGGTPTSLALRFAAELPALSSDPAREHFVLLITDGPPNCNPANTNTCMAPNACRCTIAGGGCAGANCVVGCLDRQATFDAVALARSREIETLVVGVGPEVLTADSLDVFNGLAQAGGYPLACPAGGLNECGGGNACLGDRTCERKFAADLPTGLARVGTILRRSATCRYLLQVAVPDASALEVKVNGLVVAPGPDGWQLENASTVRFQGSVCTVLSTPGSTAQVTFALAR